MPETDRPLALKFQKACVMLATAQETAQSELLTAHHRTAIAQALELLAAELRDDLLDGEVVT